MGSSQKHIKACVDCGSADTKVEFTFAGCVLLNVKCGNCGTVGPAYRHKDCAVSTWNEMVINKRLLREVYNLDYGYDRHNATLRADEWQPLYEKIAEVFEKDGS